jgi:hypothetical protein
MRSFAQRIFFHRRGTKGITFSEFEERLAVLAMSIAPEPAAAAARRK